MSDAALIKASVVIPTKNGGSRFEAVLQAVVDQETDWPFEIIVIDSGSKDRTLAIAKKFPEVRLLTIDSDEFQHGRTRNQAIDQSIGEYVAMITQDAQPVDKHWLRSLVTEIEQDDQIAGVFGRHLAYDDASIFTHQELVQHFSGFESQPVVQLTDHERYAIDSGYQQFLYFYSDNNSLLRRSVWQHYPYPEVEFAEDQAWAKVIIEAGYKKAYSHAAAVYHSHNYGLWERFQRSFDEGMAIEELFHYRQPNSIIVIPRRWLGLTLRDLKLVKSQKTLSLWKKVYLTLWVSTDNLMRVTGGWLGTHAGFGNASVIGFCSRDKKLKRVDHKP